MIILGEEFFVANGKNEIAVGNKLDSGFELAVQKVSPALAAKIQAKLEI